MQYVQSLAIPKSTSRIHSNKSIKGKDLSEHELTYEELEGASLRQIRKYVRANRKKNAKR